MKELIEQLEEGKTSATTKEARKLRKEIHGILEFVVDAFDAWEGLPPSDNDIKEVRKAIDGQVKERLKKLLGLVDKFKPRKGGKGLI